ncbi:NAD(P)-binding protein [Trichoderma citrinoviride]|uniref:NAD(P)-binding protein n=1 Tax=Trichoderma citrinoviride TaxID=58853 RepID=A0A2T4B1D7_9HYPO|nr:NAD(P)-binding protein [Trichoderma citrinoviride]PTB63048.1 NAD(P)-binding protein [Trichoderma citrinoviride]
MSRYAAVHAWDNLAGENDARPTAEQIIKDAGKQDLKGQVIIITGVSSGCGAASARALAATGAELYLAGRSVPKAKAALSTIADMPNVHFLELDLASNASIKTFAADFLKQSGGRLNVLLNNAGGVIAERKVTEDGFERQLAINHLGSFLLFALLKDALLASASPSNPSRVINVTSVGHRYGTIRWDDPNFEKGEYNPTAAYGQAKTAAVYAASEIDRRYGAQNLHAWSVHPGGIVDSAFLTNSGWDKSFLDNMVANWPKKLFKSSEQGAATQVWAAVSDDVLAEGVTGKYLEDCSVAVHMSKSDSPEWRGHCDHTYNEEDAKRTWELSEKLLGIKV